MKNSQNGEEWQVYERYEKRWKKKEWENQGLVSLELSGKIGRSDMDLK